MYLAVAEREYLLCAVRTDTDVRNMETHNRKHEFSHSPTCLTEKVMSHHSTGPYITDIIEKCLQTNNEACFVHIASPVSTLSQSLILCWLSLHLIVRTARNLRVCND